MVELSESAAGVSTLDLNGAFWRALHCPARQWRKREGQSNVSNEVSASHLGSSFADEALTYPHQTLSCLRLAPLLYSESIAAAVTRKATAPRSAGRTPTGEPSWPSFGLLGVYCKVLIVNEKVACSIELAALRTPRSKRFGMMRKRQGRVEPGPTVRTNQTSSSRPQN